MLLASVHDGIWHVLRHGRLQDGVYHKGQPIESTVGSLEESHGGTGEPATTTRICEANNKTKPLNTVSICLHHKHATRVAGFDMLIQWHQIASRKCELLSHVLMTLARWYHEITALTSAKTLLCWCAGKLAQSNMGRSAWKLLMSCISQGIERFLHEVTTQRCEAQHETMPGSSSKWIRTIPM